MLRESDMDITVRELKDVDVVSVTGRVDSNTSPKLDQTLKGLVENGRYKLVLDLAGVEYMSSAGLRAMVSCLRHMLNITDQKLFQVFDDQVGAVGSF